MGRAFLFSVALEATVVPDATLLGLALGVLLRDWLWPLVEVFVGLGWRYSLVGLWPGVWLGFGWVWLSWTWSRAWVGAFLLTYVGTADCLSPLIIVDGACGCGRGYRRR